MARKRIITGIKPTGSLHIGNYFGTVQQMIELQKKGDMFMFLADLHSLTNLHERDTLHDGENLRHLSHTIILEYIALGIDPKHTVIYRQSEFPHIAELAWVFCCLLNHTYLQIGHAYKDALQQGRQVGLGTFLYPALMAADILIFKADIVPVGNDQLQHIEIAREIARKFNFVVGREYFKEPQEYTMEEVSVIPGTSGGKMSKSKNNVLPIFGDKEEIIKKIMSIKTDSTPAGSPIQPETCIICDYLKLVLSKREYKGVDGRCREGNITYKELKEMLAESYFEYFADARNRYESLRKDEEYVDKVLKSHRKYVTELLRANLNEVHAILGLQPLSKFR